MAETSQFRAAGGAYSQRQSFMKRSGQVQVDPRDFRCAVNSESSVLISGGTPGMRATLAKMIHLNRADGNGRFVSLDRAGVAFPWLSGDTLFVAEINQLSVAAGRELAGLIERGRPGAAPRIIAATGERLDRTPLSVTIPDDLFYRLNIIHIVLPPAVAEDDLASIFGRRGM